MSPENKRIPIKTNTFTVRLVSGDSVRVKRLAKPNASPSDGQCLNALACQALITGSENQLPDQQDNLVTTHEFACLLGITGNRLYQLISRESFEERELAIRLPKPRKPSSQGRISLYLKSEVDAFIPQFTDYKAQWKWGRPKKGINQGD